MTAAGTRLTSQNFGFCALQSFSEGVPLNATGLSENKLVLRHKVEDMVVQKAVLSRCLKKKCFGANRFVRCSHEE